MTQGLFALSLAVAGLMFVPTSILANNYVVGQSSNGSVSINDANNWVVIRSATVNIGGGDGSSHGCVATASADVDSPGPTGQENKYRFVLSRVDTNPPTDGGSERIVELVDNEGADDPDSKSVATTRSFTGLTNDNGANGTGAHTFYLLGRKVEAADTNTSALDASLSVMCVDTP